MLVSILVPAYNSERWIAQTLESAVSQTWKEKEIIVVDDGSTDGTLAVARTFESAQVKVTQQPNRGAASARNTAFSFAQGDYIQWLDADDLLHPEKIARQMSVAKAITGSRLLLSGAWATFSGRFEKVKFSSNELWADQSPVDWLVRKLGGNLHMQTATWLTSRVLTEEAGPWNSAMWVDDDGEYFCRILALCEGIKFVPEAKVFYRLTNGNRLSLIGSSDKKKEAMLSSIKLHIATLRGLEDSERTRLAALRYLQNWLPAFYPERPDLVAAMEDSAVMLGGRLQAPTLPWKYAWIKALAGWATAKKAQQLFPYLRYTVGTALERPLQFIARAEAGKSK